MKWQRDAPGRYRLIGDDDVVAIVERSAIMPWAWWWSTWGANLDQSGMAVTLQRAKAKVAEMRSAAAFAARLDRRP